MLAGIYGYNHCEHSVHNDCSHALMFTACFDLTRVQNFTHVYICVLLQGALLPITGRTTRPTLLQATDPSEKERNLVALTYARQADLRQQTLDMVLDPSVRSQDTLSLLSGVAGRSNAAAHAAWTFLTQWAPHAFTLHHAHVVCFSVVSWERGGEEG